MPTYGVAVPGTVVPSGSQASPAGAQGIQGTAGSAGSAGPAGANSWTLSTASFTVPNVGATAVMTVNDTSWAVVGEFVWVATAGGSANAPMALQVTAKTPTTLTLLNPPTAGTTPSGDPGNLLSVGSDSLLYLPPSALDPEIWSVRLRSFNAVGNPTFEVDQRNCNTLVGPILAGAFGQDRWPVAANGTMRANYQAVRGTGIAIPGTSFVISAGYGSISVGTVEASLAAGEFWMLNQTIEGPLWRELSGDISSITILAWSNVALTFAISFRSPDATVSLVKRCTLSANTWTLLPFPNIPKPTAGNFSNNPGVAGYTLSVCLACGSTYIAPATDTWQNGNFIGASGMTNFFATAGNILNIAFVQHEPGSQCSTLIDKPFTQNLDECLRYFCKSYSYGNALNTSNTVGAPTAYIPASGQCYIPVMFKKVMAKNPTVTGYSPVGGPNNVYDATGTTNRGITGVIGLGDTGFSGFSLGSVNAALALYQFHYTADTGW